MMSNDDCSICCNILVLLCQQKKLEQTEKTFESAMEAQQVRQQIYWMYSINCSTAIGNGLPCYRKNLMLFVSIAEPVSQRETVWDKTRGPGWRQKQAWETVWRRWRRLAQRWSKTGWLFNLNYKMLRHVTVSAFIAHSVLTGLVSYY